MSHQEQLYNVETHDIPDLPQDIHDMLNPEEPPEIDVTKLASYSTASLEHVLLDLRIKTSRIKTESQSILDNIRKFAAEHQINQHRLRFYSYITNLLEKYLKEVKECQPNEPTTTPEKS